MKIRISNLALLLLILSGLTIPATAQSGRRASGATARTSSASPSLPSSITTDSSDSATTTAAVTVGTNGKTYSESLPITKQTKGTQTPAATNQTTAAKKTDAAGKPDATDKPATDDDEVLRVETSLVTIPVSVFDRDGLFIPNLHKEDFKIMENGKEQEIGYFGTTETPFTVVLLIDTSPSTDYKIEEIQDAAISFVNQLQAKDGVMVAQFAQNIKILTEVTTDRAQITKAIRRANFGDGTSLYDAVDYVLKKKLSKIAGRKAIVLFTDGVDTTSFKSDYDRSIEAATEADTIIFPVYFNTFGDQAGINGGNNGGVMSSPLPPIFGGGGWPNGGGRRNGGGGWPGNGGGMGRGGNNGQSRAEYARGKRYLDDLARRTGGRVYEADSQRGSLETAFAAIAEELRRQYSIGYYPSETAQQSNRQTIKIRVDRPNLIIRTPEKAGN